MRHLLLVAVRVIFTASARADGHGDDDAEDDPFKRKLVFGIGPLYLYDDAADYEVVDTTLFTS